MKKNGLHRQGSAEKSQSRRRRIPFVVTVILVFVFGGYLGGIVWRCTINFKKHTHWDKNSDYPSRLDKNYGYIYKPNTRAIHLLTSEDRIPVILDGNGFRIPSQENKRDAKTSELQILFLGSSVTYGYGVPAEKTFAHLAARKLNATAMNAGVPGWGLPGMVLRARDIIPRLKPEIVVVQYSVHLPERASNLYLFTNRGRLPMPYFYESEGIIDIHPPVYYSENSKILRMSEFQEKGLFSFAAHVGPRLIRDDFLALCIFMKRHLRLLPSPITSRQKAVDFAYNEIQKLCSANGSQMLIVVIPRARNDYPQERLDVFSWRVVHTLDFLKKKLPQSTEEAWSTNYQIWRGDPPRLVDKHPNVRMHGIIAEKLTEAIHSIPKGKTQR